MYLCILDRVLITAPIRSGVHGHHPQTVPFDWKFFETHQMISSTCWSPTSACNHVMCFREHTVKRGWGWCQLTTKRAGAIINMRSSLHRTGHKCWSVKGDTSMRHGIHNITMIKCPFLVTVYMFVNPVPKFLIRFTARVFHYKEHNRHIHAFFIPRFHSKCIFFFNWLWKRNLLVLDILYVTGSHSHNYTGNHMRTVCLTKAK